MSFGPAFIVVNLTTESVGKGYYTVNAILLVFILLTFISNAISVHMLTQVQSQTKLGSYQEVAYWISKGNRGYIFLISLMKTVYLVTTCAYCLQFIGNYLAVLTQLLITKVAGTDFYTVNSWLIWLIYIGWLLVTGIASFFFYRTKKCHNSLMVFANVLFYFAIASVTLLVFCLILCASDQFKNFVYEQVCYNG